jgi:hypothetical protein
MWEATQHLIYEWGFILEVVNTVTYIKRMGVYVKFWSTQLHTRRGLKFWEKFFFGHVKKRL